MVLNVLSKLMISAVEDGNTGSEVTASKNLALDHLGDIAAKLKMCQISRNDIVSIDQVS